MAKRSNSSSNPTGDPHRFEGKMGLDKGKVQITGMKNPMNGNKVMRGEAQPGHDLRPETRGNK